MNKQVAQFFMFGNKRRRWYERPFTRKNTNWMWTALSGVGLGASLGAGLMYIFDPDRGGYRRAYARDKVAGAVTATGETISQRSRDLKDRARGVISNTSSFFHRNSAP
jgi:hypothetical protein